MINTANLGTGCRQGCPQLLVATKWHTSSTSPQPQHREQVVTTAQLKEENTVPVGKPHPPQDLVWQANNTNLQVCQLTQAEPDARCARTVAALTTPTAINSVQPMHNFS